MFEATLGMLVNTVVITVGVVAGLVIGVYAALLILAAITKVVNLTKKVFKR